MEEINSNSDSSSNKNHIIPDATATNPNHFNLELEIETEEVKVKVDVEDFLMSREEEERLPTLFLNTIQKIGARATFIAGFAYYSVCN